MTSVQLAQRLLRYLNTNDLANLPADMALGLCDAINGSIQEYYSRVPSAYKGTTFSGSFLPAVNVTANFTNGSNFFTGWSAMEAQKGFTITAGSDPRQNTIIGPNELMDVYLGPSGPQAAQVYGDVLHMENIIEKFTSDPVLVDWNRVLVRDENWRREGVRSVFPGTFQLYPFGSYSQRQIRTPWKYWIERQGESQGAYPPFMLRTDSLPDVEYRVRVEGLLAPAQINILALTTPVNLALDWYIVESMVLPMAAKRLMTHPLWRDPKINKSVDDDYKTAVGLTLARTSDQGASNHFCGTPAGW